MEITVVVCTYNRCDGILATLDDLAAQSFPAQIEWEVLIVDNNSSDRTSEVVGVFCHGHADRFRYVFEPRPGLSYARNAGIAHARGNILAFTDDDVAIEPDWLWTLTSALRSGEWAGAGGRIIPQWLGPLPSWLRPDDPDIMGPFVAFEPAISAGSLGRPPYGASMAFRREVFERYGGFRTDLGRSPGNLQGREDIEFGNRLLKRGERLRYEPCAIVRHPAPAARMTQAYVLRWWYWFGRAEVVDTGSPAGARLLVGGVPAYLFRRLARWTVQWLTSLTPTARFSSKRLMWYLAGTITACHLYHRQQAGSRSTCDAPSEFESKPKQPATK